MRAHCRVDPSEWHDGELLGEICRYRAALVAKSINILNFCRVLNKKCCLHICRRRVASCVKFDSYKQRPVLNFKILACLGNDLSRQIPEGFGGVCVFVIEVKQGTPV